MSTETRRTAVVVPVPAAEPLVSAWRTQYDPSAAVGMPAHITALFPFLHIDYLSDAALATLLELCAELPALNIVFRRTGRFPGVLYLDPEPAEGLRQLTVAIAEQWPQAPPYGGSFEDVIPHLTVATGVAESLLAEIEMDVLGGLPVEARLEEAWLYMHDGRRWRPRTRLPFRDR